MEKKQIDEYVLENLLGEGSFGSVYKTTKINSNEVYATKVIPKRLLNQGRSYEFFKREVEILKKIDHKNINKLYSEKETNNNHYLILEYCNGGDLFKISSQYKKKNGKPLPEEFVQYYVGQICDALHYLHDKNIIHRDLKLENILVHFDNEKDKNELNIFESKIKLIDFGLARTIDHQNLASSICGSPIIMDPQLLSKLNKESKEFHYNEKADIWALGTITYELLVGTLPFNASNYDELLNKINKGQYNIPDNLKLSVESIAFLNGLLQFEPKNRLGWNDILKHSFLLKNVKDFTKLDLKKIDNKFKSVNDLKLNTMDKNNFLWVLFKNDVINDDLSRVTEIQSFPIINGNKKINNFNANLPGGKLYNQGVININNFPNLDIVKKNNEVVRINDHPKKNVETIDNNHIKNVTNNNLNDNDNEYEQAIKASQHSFENDKKRKNIEEVKIKENPKKQIFQTPDGNDVNPLENIGNYNINNFFDMKDFVDLATIESK